MVFRGEYGRRSSHASLVPSTFTSQQSLCLLDQDPCGIASYLLAQQNGASGNDICARFPLGIDLSRGRSTPVRSPMILISPLSGSPCSTGGHLYDKTTGRPGASESGATAACLFATRRTT